MSIVLGSGNFRYRVVEDWPVLPEGFVLGDVAGAVVDSRQRIFCYTRGPRGKETYSRDETDQGQGVLSPG